MPNPRFHRPAEVDILLGNAAKARAKLGWQPTVDFASLAREMVDADLRQQTEAPEQDRSWT